MKRTVEISGEAQKILTILLNFLEVEWSLKVRNAFLEKLDRSISVISQFPESCQETNFKRGIRRCVVSKQTSFLYLHTDSKIKIITIFDNRMDPTTNKIIN